MTNPLKVDNIPEALAQRKHPTITTWNRLEGRPRTRNFERALQAEVRDALWMLTKQWQMGEFRGSDTGSPVLARLLMETTRLTKYRPDTQAVQLFEYDVPLEAKVERRPIALSAKGHPVALDVRLLMGRQWLALIAPIGNSKYRQAFIDTYPIIAPDPTRKDNADYCAHPEVWQMYAAVAGRAMDGAALYTYLKKPANHAYDPFDKKMVIPKNHKAALDDCAARFVAWFERLFYQPPPSGDNAWIPERLEYQFSASAPAHGGEKVYVADEYYQGRLDWYAFDIDLASSGLDPISGSEVTGLEPDLPKTIIPTPVSYAGMPNTRWWTFEDCKTNYGNIDANTTDLAKLLFIEFMLVYANDWFLIPYTLPVGAIAEIHGFAVTNVFGERFWIKAADRGADSAWQRWSMFTITGHGNPGAAVDTSLLLVPTVPLVQQGPPAEEILLMRDEVANMVWGVEKTIPLANGESKPGSEAADEKLAFLKHLLDQNPGTKIPDSIKYAAPIRYELMNTVPEHWIPFIPVHIDGDNREIQLQRAAFLRILEGDPDIPVKIEPSTSLLREGCDCGKHYFIYEEEIPRAGVRLTLAFQRTRWLDGRVITWLGVHKQTGHGEGSSGLAFDRIVDVQS